MKLLNNYLQFFEDTGIVILDALGNIENSNNYFCDISGYAKKEVESKKFSELIKIEDISKMGSMDFRFRDGEQYKVILVRKDGTGIPAEILISISDEKDNKKVIIIFIKCQPVINRENSYDAEYVFRQMYENSSVGATLVKLTTRFKYCNKEFCNFLNYSEKELTEKKIQEVTYPLDRSIAMNEMKMIIKGELESFKAQKRYVTKNNDIVWGEVTITSIRGKEGNPQYFLAIVRNITDQITMEKALRESEEKYRLLADNVPGMICYVDTSLKYIFVNEYFANFYNRNRDQIIGKHVGEILGEDGLKKARPFIDKALSGESIYYEISPLFSHIEQKWFASYNVPHKLSNGEVVGYYSLIIDIDKRKRAERALQEREEQYRLLAENISDVIWILDLDEVKYRYLSPSIEKLRGYTVEEVKNQVFEAQMTEDSLRFLMDAFPVRIQALREGFTGPYTDLTEQKRKDGTTVWTEVTTRYSLNPTTGHTEIYGVTRDISRRKMAEEALLESEERYRILYEHAGIGIIYFMTDGKIISFNLVASQYFNELKDRKQEYDIYSILPNDKADFYLERIQLTAQSEGPFVYEDEILLSSGKKWFLSTFTKVMNSKNKITGVQIIFLDITERKKAEEIMRQEKIFSENLIESLPGIFYMFDSEMNAIRWNKNKQELLGLDPEEMKGHKILESIADEDKQTLIDSVTKAMTYGEASDEIKIIRHDKKILTYQLTGKRLDLPDGPALIGVGIDITGRKIIDEELKRNKELIDEVVSATPVGIYRIIVTSKGNWNNESELTYNHDFVSDLYCWMMGFTKEEIMSDFNLLFKIIHPDDLGEFKRINLNTIISFEPFKWEGRIIVNGKTTWVRRESTPRKMNDNEYIWTGYMLDISEQKRAEEEHLRLQNLESLGILAGGIAHDFNNILSTILGRASIAAEDAPEGIFKSDLIEIEKATIRAVSLTQQLLTFAKGGTPEKCIIDIKKIIKETASFSLSGSNIIFEYDFEDTMNIEADPGQISQVIQNIVINAKQAMPNGGLLNIKTLDYVDTQGKAFVKIVIEDHGMGIPKEHLSKIFNPYYSTKQTGSGLGLSVCYSIITRHEGKVLVSSELNKGSTFTILLPATSTKISLKTEMEGMVRRKLNVLIMDDEESIRDLLSNLIVRLGHSVTATKEGMESIKYYMEAKEKGNPYDVVFMDLTIKGGMGGKDAVKKLKEMDPLAKVIVSSGYANSSRANYKTDGFDGVLNKPYTKKDLNLAIYEVLRNK